MRKAAILLLAGVVGAVAPPIVHAAQHAGADRGDAPPSAQAPRDFGTAGDSLQSTSCEPFDVRVELGKAAEEKEEFRSYHSAMIERVGGQYAATMRSCFATIREPQNDRFTLVGDITAEGELDAVEVRPLTNIASCFAAGLRTISFPKPPRYPGRSGFPMTIDMQIR
jgi:hypothetical protein